MCFRSEIENLKLEIRPDILEENEKLKQQVQMLMSKNQVGTNDFILLKLKDNNKWC